jgi:hypothetical protein
MRPRQTGRPKRRYRRRTVRVLVEYVSDAGLCVDPATTLGAGGLFIETESPLFEHIPAATRPAWASSSPTARRPQAWRANSRR